jgi:hypothetical protein
MPLHLIKMAVGIDDLEHLRRFRAQRRETQPLCLVRTRNTPRRAAEILAGGSLYWVIRGQVLVRQRVLEITTEPDAGGRLLCIINLEHELVPTLPQPRRPFQGWRYLEPADAPPDHGEAGSSEMPWEMLRELKELGLL